MGGSRAVKSVLEAGEGQVGGCAGGRGNDQ